jgi:RecB family exonuclease
MQAPPSNAELIATISATQLETYAQCPARAYFSFRLRLRASGDGDDRFSLLFGQATHTALEKFFSQPEREPAQLPDFFSAALAEKAPALSPDLPLSTMLRAQFARVSALVPELEKAVTAISGGAQPTFFERPFGLDIGGVRVRGTIDRIDRLPDGSLLVIDYKTGAVDFTPQHIAEGSHFQALIYALAAESLLSAPCAGVVFYDLKKGEIRRGWLREDRLPREAARLLTRGHVLAVEKFETLRAQGIERLQEIAAAMSQGNFEARPSAEVCGYCEFALLCRRSATHD